MRPEKLIYLFIDYFINFHSREIDSNINHFDTSATPPIRLHTHATPLVTTIYAGQGMAGEHDHIWSYVVGEQMNKRFNEILDQFKNERSILICTFPPPDSSFSPKYTHPSSSSSANRPCPFEYYNIIHTFWGRFSLGLPNLPFNADCSHNSRKVFLSSIHLLFSPL